MPNFASKCGVCGSKFIYSNFENTKKKTFLVSSKRSGYTQHKKISVCKNTTVLVWGTGLQGEIGNFSDTLILGLGNSKKCVETPQENQFFAEKEIVDIYSGEIYNVAVSKTVDKGTKKEYLTKDGQICFQWGELKGKSRIHEPKRLNFSESVTLSENTTFKQLALGQLHGLALTSN
jgi:hypothetical protein